MNKIFFIFLICFFVGLSTFVLAQVEIGKVPEDIDGVIIQIPEPTGSGSFINVSNISLWQEVGNYIRPIPEVAQNAFITTTAKLLFNKLGTFIHSPSDGILELETNGTSDFSALEFRLDANSPDFEFRASNFNCVNITLTPIDDDSALIWCGHTSILNITKGQLSVQNILQENPDLISDFYGLTRFRDLPSSLAVTQRLFHMGDSNTYLTFPDNNDSISFFAGNRLFLTVTEASQDVITFNPNSEDIDFRFNSDTSTPLFISGASNGFLGIGSTTQPSYLSSVGYVNVQYPTNRDYFGIKGSSGQRDTYFLIQDSSNANILNVNATAPSVDIHNLLNIIPQATAPTTGIGAGSVYTDTSGAICYYNGTGWEQLDASGGSCT